MPWSHKTNNNRSVDLSKSEPSTSRVIILSDMEQKWSFASKIWLIILMFLSASERTEWGHLDVRSSLPKSSPPKDNANSGGGDNKNKNDSKTCNRCIAHLTFGGRINGRCNRGEWFFRGETWWGRLRWISEGRSKEVRRVGKVNRVWMSLHHFKRETVSLAYTGGIVYPWIIIESLHKTKSIASVLKVISV